MSVADSGWGTLLSGGSPKFDFSGDQAIEKMVRDFEFKEVLDLGCGAGLHTEYFRRHGKSVVTLDAGHYHTFKPDYVGDYQEIKFERQFEAIWTAHVLEHVFDVHSFLCKIYDDLQDGGVLAVTVPPLKHDIVSGHVNLFNTGLLVYRLILAGFDCRQAAAKAYGYNISVIVRKVAADVPRGTWSLPKIAHLFPFPVKQGFDGRIIEANWAPKTAAQAPAAA